MASTTGYQLLNSLASTKNQYDAQLAMIRKLINQLATATIVQIVAVTNTGADAIAGLVDVQPLIDQKDGDGNPVPYTTLYQLPYFRMQGGANAVIMDPQVGDVGIALFASRDISAVVSQLQATPLTAAQDKGLGAPPTWRTYDYADGIYIGGILNGVPTQYVQFNSSGINITSTAAVTINAPSVTIANGGTAAAVLNNTLLTWLEAHTHTVVALGSPTGAPLTTPPSTVATSVLKAQ